MAARLGIVSKSFRQNIARPGQGFLRSGDRLLLIGARHHKLGGFLLRIQGQRLIFHEPVGERFQAFFAGHRRAGAALRSIRREHIFQRGHGHGRRDFLLQLRCEQFSLLQRLEDGGPAGFQFEQLRHAITNVGDGDFIE